VKRKEIKAVSHKATKSTNLPVGRQGFTKKKPFVLLRVLRDPVGRQAGSCEKKIMATSYRRKEKEMHPYVSSVVFKHLRNT